MSNHMGGTDIKYQRNPADGSFVAVETSSTGHEIVTQVVVPKGGSMIYNDKTQSWQLFQDVAVYQRQRDLESHKEYAEEVGNAYNFSEDATEEQQRATRARMKRMEAYSGLLQQTAMMDRVEPGQQQKKVTDEAAQDLREEYERESAKFKSPADYHDYAERGGFVPLPTYIHKLQRKNGSWLRKVFKGELGMIGRTVIVYEPGYGEGHTVNVLKDVEK